MSEIVQPTTEQPAAPRRLKWTNIILWSAVLLLLAVLGWGLINSSEERPDGTAPDFQMHFFDGYQWEGRERINLSDWQGQVVVLNFWASWCVECRVEAQLLEDTWQEYRDQGVIFVGVAYVDVEPKSKDYLQEFGITYPNAPDLRSLASTEYNVTGVPETFFIAKDGRVAHITIGPLGETELTGTIEQLLQEQPSPTTAQ
jgi:cytochrome c biogenesis protein CcmG, thiol:disulfide interchange protein DsbE